MARTTKNKPKRKRHFRRVIGKISPLELYTVEGCLRYAGLGRVSLGEARRSGIVKPLEKGHRVYYRGSELIEWISRSSETARAIEST